MAPPSTSATAQFNQPGQVAFKEDPNATPRTKASEVFVSRIQKLDNQDKLKSTPTPEQEKQNNQPDRSPYNVSLAQTPAGGPPTRAAASLRVPDDLEERHNASLTAHEMQLDIPPGAPTNASPND